VETPTDLSGIFPDQQSSPHSDHKADFDATPMRKVMDYNQLKPVAIDKAQSNTAGLADVCKILCTETWIGVAKAEKLVLSFKILRTYRLGLLNSTLQYYADY